MKPGMPLVVTGGRPLGSNSLRQIISNTRSAQQTRIAGGLGGMSGALGSSFASSQGFALPNDCVLAQIQVGSGVTAYPFQVLQIASALTATPGSGFMPLASTLSVGVPVSANAPLWQLGILQPDASGPRVNGQGGILQTQGIAIVQYDGTSGSGPGGLVQFGDMLGTQVGSAIATCSGGGNIPVICHYASWNSKYYALVNLSPPASTTQGICFVFDGGGSVLTNSMPTQYVWIPKGATIKAATILSEPSAGNLAFSVGVGACATGSFPTTSSICASAPPTLSSARMKQDSTLVGWSPNIPAGYYLAVAITGTPTVITWASLTLAFA